MEERLCKCGCGRPCRRIVNKQGKVWYTKYHEDSCRGRFYSKRTKAIQEGEMVPLCLCGCGQPVSKNIYGKWNKYIANHYRHPKEAMALLWDTGKFGRPKGYKLSESTKARMSDTHKRRWEDPEYRKRRLSEYKTRPKKDIGDPPLCLCGCGLPVGRSGNHWNKFINGHYGEYIKRISRGDPPLCACGCGNPVRWSERSHCWNKYLNVDHCRQDPNYRKAMSETMNNPDKLKELSDKSKANYQNPEYVEKMQKSMNRRPNGFESLFERLKPDLFIKYVGDFKLWITLPNGKPKNPDFIIEGTNKVIELHGDYWHQGEDDTELIKLYKDAGYECLVIWENEMSDIHSVMNRVSDFLKIK